MPKSYQYKAFISYSHADKKWGDWLHKKLEAFRVPKALVGKQSTYYNYLPHRLIPIFRDREELSTSAYLGAMIDTALQESSHLIVICSPRAAKSKWVNQEILQFKRMGKANRILCLIVDGEPYGAEKPELGLEECFPQAIKFKLGSDGNLSSSPAEPIAGDAREGKDGKENALLKLVAGLLGVGFDQLKQRQALRRRKRLILLNSISLAMVGLMAIMTIWAFAQGREAENQKVLALASKELAEIARDDAIKQKKIADLANEKARKENYYNQIGLADAKIKEGDYEYAQNLLWTTDPELRHWEWGRLLSLTDNSLWIYKTSSVPSKIEISEDEKYVVVTMVGDKINIIELGNPNSPRAISIHSENVHKILAKSPKKNLFATAGTDGEISIWQCPTGKIFHRFTGHSKGFENISDLAFSKDGNFLGVAMKNGKIKIWSLATDSILRVLDVYPLEVHSLAFFSDDQLFAGLNHSKISRFNFKTGLLIGTKEIPTTGIGPNKSKKRTVLKKLKISNSGDRMCVLRYKDAILFKTNDLKIIKIFNHERDIWSADFSDDDMKLICGGSDKKIYTWDLSDEKNPKPKFGHSGSINSVRFFADGKGIISTSNDRTIRISAEWNSQGIFTKYANRRNNWSDLSREKTMGLSAGEGIYITNPESQAFLAGFGAKEQSEINKAFFCLDDTHIISLDDNGSLALYEIKSKKIINRFLNTYKFVNLEMWDDDSLALAIDQTKRAIIFDLENGIKIKDFELTHWPIQLYGRPNLVSPSGKFLAVFQSKNQLDIIDMTKEEKMQELRFKKLEPNSVQSFAFAPDEKHFIVSDPLYPRNAALYNFHTKEKIHSFQGHGATIRSFAFSNDGERIFTSSLDQTCKIWEVNTGRELLSFTIGHSTSISVSEDDSWLSIIYGWDTKVFKSANWATTKEDFLANRKLDYSTWIRENSKE